MNPILTTAIDCPINTKCTVEPMVPLDANTVLPYFLILIAVIVVCVTVYGIVAVWRNR